MKAEHDAVHEAGLLPTHDTLLFATHFALHLLCQFSKRCLCGTGIEGLAISSTILAVQFADHLNALPMLEHQSSPFFFSDDVYQSSP